MPECPDCGDELNDFGCCDSCGYEEEALDEEEDE